MTLSNICLNLSARHYSFNITGDEVYLDIELSSEPIITRMGVFHRVGDKVYTKL